MKPIKIKAWPELNDYIPLLTSVSRTTRFPPSLYIDFSNVTCVNSCGLTAFIVKLFQFINNKLLKKQNEISWSSNNDYIDTPLIDKIIKLGFFNQIEYFYEKSIFNNDYYFTSPDKRVPISYYDENIKYTAFPIFHLELSQYEDRRTPVRDLNEYLMNNLHIYSSIYNFNIRQFLTIIYEIGKNASDHTQEDAYMGLDVIESKNVLKIRFLFADLGMGITKSIKEYAKEHKEQFENYHNRDTSKFAFYDAYHFACTHGNTTKRDSGCNYGLGMDTILGFSKALNVRLSVFDAESRGVLTLLNNLTHSRIRKVFCPTTIDFPFCYFGEVEAWRKS